MKRRTAQMILRRGPVPTRLAETQARCAGPAAAQKAAHGFLAVSVRCLAVYRAAALGCAGRGYRPVCAGGRP